MNVIFDASIIANYYNKNSSRSGVFFVAKNILESLLKKTDIQVLFYFYSGNIEQSVHVHEDLYPDVPCIQNLKKYNRLIKLKRKLLFLYEKIYSKKMVRKIPALGILLLNFILRKTLENDCDRELMKKASCFFSPIYEVPRIVRKYRNIRPFIFLHDCIPFLFPEYYLLKTNDALKVMHSTVDGDYFFINSQATQEDFKKFFPIVTDVNSSVAYLAADSSFSTQKDKKALERVQKKYNLSRDKKYVFSLCSLEPRKNLLRAVKCFLCFLEKNNINDLVWVMGGSAWTSFIETLSKECCNWDPEAVVRIGYVDDEDLPILYSNAEWFVYTSQYEGFGLPPLEAMQCGCPVITSNNSSLPEVIGNAGIMIDWDSDEQHVEAYEKYYFNENLRKENSCKGIERAKHFSWEKTVEKIVSVMNVKTLTNNDKLNIIYRVCDKVNVSSSNKRCFDVSKNQLIKKCLSSLKKCVDKYNGTLDFYCVADNCSDDIISFIKSNFPKVILERFDKIGNAESFCKCVEVALNLPNKEQVYFLEDDYLFLNDNVLDLLNFNLNKISRETDSLIAIMPDDYPDRYKDNSITTECHITETGHFLKIDKTTCTFATYTDVVKKYKKFFMRFSKWPQVTENESVNKVWKRVSLYQPVPAWTLHCQIKNIVPIYLDFKRILQFFENAENSEQLSYRLYKHEDDC